MKGTCRLCGNETKLRLSHIFPRFAVKWLKSTSATGFLRDNISRKRQQETEREYLLCGECEQLIGVDENHFRENIFIPYHEKQVTTFEYGPWLKRFLVGLHWRVLVTWMADQAPPASHSRTAVPPLAQTFLDAQNIWRDFLLRKTEDPGGYEYHIFFANVTNNASRPVPQKFNWYLARSLDATPIHNEMNEAMVYAKVIKIITASFLTPRNAEREHWEGTEVFDEGVLRVPQIKIIRTTDFGLFLEGRARLMEGPSPFTPRQFQKIMKLARENPQKIVSSESYKVYLAERKLRNDMRMHALSVEQKGGDRNNPCICGSGKKFKECCGSISG